MTAQEIAKRIRESPDWKLDLCAALCEMADMREEWDNANGESLESVVFKAAESLGVEIV